MPSAELWKRLSLRNSKEINEQPACLFLEVIYRFDRYSLEKCCTICPILSLIEKKEGKMKMKRCPLCESEYEFGDYCPSCGVLLQNDRYQGDNNAVSGFKRISPHYTKEKKLVPDEIRRADDKTGVKSHITRKSAVAILCSMVIVLCSIFAIKFGKNLFRPSSESVSFVGNDTVSQEEFTKDDKNSLSYNNETTDGDTEEDENGFGQEDYDIGWHSILSVNNSYIDINQCLDLDDYLLQMSEDESFAFAYPIHFFNIGNMRDDGQCYAFICDDENYYAKLQVYKRQNIGDPVLNCMRAAQEYAHTWENIQYEYPADREPQADEYGMARKIVQGICSKADAKMEYVIAANDGQYDYIMDFQYKDPQPENDYDETGYILDCLYRYCSFSGGTYQPRTYSQFLENDMGEKKITEKNEDGFVFILDESDREYISDYDLENMDPQELTYARNEIYARHGYIFQSKELAEYFSRKDWYHPDSEFDESTFNEYEKYNSRYILNYQKQHGMEYKPE